MSNKNRSVRLALARIYGNGCMFLRSGAEQYIENLGNIRTYKKYKAGLKFKSKKMQIYEDILTLHHLQHKAEGGKASVENGAIINAIAHQYLHSLPRNEEEVINDYIREWKKLMYKEVTIEKSDIQIPFEVVATELSIDRKGKLDVKRLNKDKERRQEKRDMQRLKKEWEDR